MILWEIFNYIKHALSSTSNSDKSCYIVHCNISLLNAIIQTLWFPDSNLSILHMHAYKLEPCEMHTDIWYDVLHVAKIISKDYFTLNLLREVVIWLTPNGLVWTDWSCRSWSINLTNVFIQTNYKQSDVLPNSIAHTCFSPTTPRTWSVKNVTIFTALHCIYTMIQLV